MTYYIPLLFFGSSVFFLAYDRCSTGFYLTTTIIAGIFCVFFYSGCARMPQYDGDTQVRMQMWTDEQQTIEREQWSQRYPMLPPPAHGY